MKKLLLILIYYLLVTTEVYSGGIYINKNSLFFNNNPQKREFLADEHTTMNFEYDNYSYGGKPYQYLVFKFYETAKISNTSNPRYLITRIGKGSSQASISFILPETDAKYRIEYHVLPFFSDRPVRSSGYFLENNNITEIKRYYAKPENIKYQQELVEIKTTAEIDHPIDADDIIIYFKNPGRVLSDLASNKALKFEWYLGGESSKLAQRVQYSYRLNPIEDWSVFDSSISANYYFLRPGDYTFEVKANYAVNGISRESNVASFQINVKNIIFQVKDEVGMKNSTPVSKDFLRIDRYNKSKALLIGVSEYSDTKFPNLPFVIEDVKMVENVLRQKYNFQVDVLTQGANRARVLAKFENFLAKAEENDRLIVYFSGHGTAIGEAGFLVPSDGKSDSKVATSISFEFISKWVDRLFSEKKVKHLFIILDSCQAGLGVYSKSSNEPAVLEISKYTGAHMMTAGLLNQKANADDTNSIFTRFLVEGLRGKSDYNSDGVITLSELLVFVQNNVSQYAKSKHHVAQTPMMGKIRGSGEMLFLRNN